MFFYSQFERLSLGGTKEASQKGEGSLEDGHLSIAHTAKQIMQIIREQVQATRRVLMGAIFCYGCSNK